MTGIDAFILVGGRSSRLGLDKAGVKLGGKTLVQRAVETVKLGLGPERISLVAGNSTQFAIEALDADVPFIFDLYDDRGPLGGLHAALAHTQTPWIFALACDYPFVSPDLVGILADKISDRFGAIVPEQFDGRIQPLCSFYRVRPALSVIEEILARPRTVPPLAAVVEQLDPCIVRFAEYDHLPDAPHLLHNINTPGDLDRAIELERDDSKAG